MRKKGAQRIVKKSTAYIKIHFQDDDACCFVKS